MAKNEEAREAKLLDLWDRPLNAGEAIGCVATSYTFDSNLFEEECLRRFLGIEADIVDSDTYFLVELENRLSQVEVVAFVDSGHSYGRRSPRWRLIPVDVRAGVMHAKVSLLVWGEHVRILVSSANITSYGYRENNELVTNFDFYAGAEADPKLARAVIDFLRELNDTHGRSSELIRASVGRLLDKAASLIRSWTYEEPALEVSFAAVLPGRGGNIFEKMKGMAPAGTSFSTAIVESPSFEQPGTRNEAAEQVWDFLRQRGEATVVYRVPGRESPKGTFELYAPEELVTAKPKRESCVIDLELVDTLLDGNARALHGKWIEFISERACVLCIGSSNFSSPALGLPKKKGLRTNIEANILIRYSRDDRKFVGRLERLVASGKEIDFEKDKIIWAPAKSRDDLTIGSQPFPGFLQSITYRSSGREGGYELEFVPDVEVPAFNLVDPGEGKELAIIAAATVGKVEVPLGKKLPASELNVVWDGNAVLFPVNIESQDSIPPPDVLLNLSLEELGEILGSKLPIESAIRKILRRKKGLPGENLEVVIDAHKKVNTASFLLQRTRRLSRVLRALRTRLEQPTFSEESLNWRLRGPFGVQGIKRAALAPVAGADERAFFLAELILELSRLKPKEAKNSVGLEAVGIAVAREVKELRTELLELQGSILEPSMRNYVGVACKK